MCLPVMQAPPPELRLRPLRLTELLTRCSPLRQEFLAVRARLCGGGGSPPITFQRGQSARSQTSPRASKAWHSDPDCRPVPAVGPWLFPEGALGLLLLTLVAFVLPHLEATVTKVVADH
jgi:hypothetical protein